MAAELIGRCVCPLCRKASGRLSLSKSGLAVITCNRCNCQVFTRSGVSDELARALYVPDDKPAPAPSSPPPEPVQPALPAPVRTATPAPAPVAEAVQPPPAAPARPAFTWGMLR